MFMNLIIVQYSNGTPAMCDYYESIGDDDMTSRPVDLKTAYKLMWELVLAGATREYRSNMFDPSISRIEVTYWARA